MIYFNTWLSSCSSITTTGWFIKKKACIPVCILMYLWFKLGVAISKGCLKNATICTHLIFIWILFKKTHKKNSDENKIFAYRSILETVTYFLFSRCLILISRFSIFFFFCTFLSYIFRVIKVKQIDSSRKNMYSEFVKPAFYQLDTLQYYSYKKASKFIINFGL